jgi:hypothetical protein
MRRRVAACTATCPDKARETVEAETPHVSAIELRDKFAMAIATLA